MPVILNIFFCLQFIDRFLSLEAVNSTSNDINNTVSQSLGTTRTLQALLDGYDRKLRPNFAGPPCKIRVSMHVLSLVPIKEIDMEVNAVVFFRQHWTDRRLAYGSLLGISKMRLKEDILDKVWLPDTYFVNEVSDGHKRPGDYLFELSQEGDIIYSYRKKLNLHCPMDLRKFPMDEQVCQAKLESYGYSEADAIYSWLNPVAIGIDDNMQIPQYTLASFDQDFSRRVYITGNYSSLAAIFRFERKLGFYVIQQFLPTIMIVALSWVGFWIDERSVPARVSLGITTVLAITTLSFGIQNSLPKVGHVKAIDVFLFGSFFFVFASLVEYAIICTFTIVDEKSKQRVRVGPGIKTAVSTNGELNCDGTIHGVYRDVQERDQQNENQTSFSSFLPSWSSRKRSSCTVKLLKRAVQSSTGQREPCTIDKHCRKLFPVAFALFLSIYFALYLFALD